MSARGRFSCFLFGISVAACAPPARPAAEPTSPLSPPWCSRLPLAERDDAWRRYWPISAASNGVHLDVVGLWGYDEELPEEDPSENSFRAVFLYDGCHVTFEYLPLRRNFFDGLEERRSGRLLNVGMANRARAAWEGDDLWAVSYLFTGPVASRVVAPDGSVSLVARRPYWFRPEDPPTLKRLSPNQCVSTDTRDMFLARGVAYLIKHHLVFIQNGRPDLELACGPVREADVARGFYY